MIRPTCIFLQTMLPATPPKTTVLCLGNFDGVHKAHQALFQEGLTLRNTVAPSAACGVFCFSEPPSHFLSEAPPPQLCSLEEKLTLLAACGMEYVFLADFPAVQDLSPEDFIQRILLEECHCVGAVCGFNYRFGARGTGTAEQLKAMLPAPVTVCPQVAEDGSPVSSTRIRRLLLDGNAENAARLLSRPYFFSAPVIHGKGLGHRWGIPTINQQIPPHRLIPRHGVYVTQCLVDGKRYTAVTNVGLRPTVDSNATVNCESFLLDFQGDLYEKTVQISFLKWIRPEIRFPSPEALQEQIRKDIQTARDFRS